MKDLRAAAEQNGDEFVNAFSAAIRPTQHLLVSLFRRLKWKGKPIEVVVYLL